MITNTNNSDKFQEIKPNFFMAGISFGNFNPFGASNQMRFMRAVDVIAFVSHTFDLFKVMCKKHHRTL